MKKGSHSAFPPCRRDFSFVASQVVCSIICECWEETSFDKGVQSVLQTAFKQASDALDAKADVLHKVEMGTTLVLAAIDGNRLYIAHSGDSRAYFFPDGVCQFIAPEILTCRSMDDKSPEDVIHLKKSNWM